MSDAEDRLAKLRRLAELRGEVERVSRPELPGLAAVKLSGRAVVVGWVALSPEERVVLRAEYPDLAERLERESEGGGDG